MKILLSGDLFYNYDEIKEDYKQILDEVSNYDLAIINYEGSFKGSNKRKKNISLLMSDNSLCLPRNVSLILCNNHITDYGTEGVLNTINKIKYKNIFCFGLNKNKNDNSYYKSFFYKENSIFIATLGWTNEECIEARGSFGIKSFNSNSINELKKIIFNYQNHLKILYIHGGYEWEKYPIPEHVGLAREAIDSGFDLVYFSHSHTIQKYEFYKDKLIHYGIGNFYFSSLRDKYPKLADKGLCLVLDIANNKMKIYYRLINYDREKKKSKIYGEHQLKKKSLIFSDLVDYSNNYKKFRFRKKNPRPILYYKKTVSNYIKYKAWKFIVEILGILNLRGFIKNLLKWN